MKKLFIYLFAITALMATFVACERNELLDAVKSDNQETETVKQNELSILTFNSEDDFYSTVENIRKMGYSNVKTRSTLQNFKSIYDEYDEAMSVADDYYTREGGYEEFKQQFPNLYYPEHGEDYAAFLPVSDEAIAKLLNKEGKVIIDGVERDFKDVSTYEKLEELGLAMPSQTESSSTRFTGLSPVIDPSIPYNVILTTSKKDINSKRRMWVTLRGIEKETMSLPYPTLKEARVDFCFRKKGKLGWYNGKLYGYPTIVILDKTQFPLERKYEYSPMKFPVMREFTAKINDFPDKSPLDIYIRFESKETYADFTAVYPANLKDILKLNNGDGFWEKFSAKLKKALEQYAAKYGSKYLTEYWNNNIND